MCFLQPISEGDSLAKIYLEGLNPTNPQAAAGILIDPAYIN